MPPEPRSEIFHTPPVVHGSPDFDELRRLGLDPKALLDFSANINPYGPSPAVRRAVNLARLDRYPDRDACELRVTIGKSLNVRPEQILVGNGSSELIWLTAFAYLPSSDRVLVLGPTYGEYARAATLAGAGVSSYNARERDGFVLFEDSVGQELAARRPQLVFLCNPNNPTGLVLNPTVLGRWILEHPQTLFVVDESYQAFADPFASMIRLEAENVLVLRSMTKDFGLAGLRLGYAVAPKPVIEAVARVRPPWSVSVPAQAAGLAALADPEFLAQSLVKLQRAKRELYDGLRELGLRPLPSAVHFFLIPVKDAAGLRGALLRRGILVRDAASFGLPGYLRIATRRPEENHQLLAVLREVLP